ncbi:MAG: hypothetical protein JRJ26_09945 [Deltaproteobacteria bacterium]|nr:hypothetical protein [Deltaproteobacteria bacterium]
MNKLCIFLAMSVFGWAGWWIGRHFGFMAGYILSLIGSIAGVYIGWRIYRDYLT